MRRYLSVAVTRTGQLDLLAVLAAHVQRDLRVLVVLLTEPQLRHAVKQLRQVLSNLAHTTRAVHVTDTRSDQERTYY